MALWIPVGDQWPVGERLRGYLRQFKFTRHSETNGADLYRSAVVLCRQQVGEMQCDHCHAETESKCVLDSCSHDGSACKALLNQSSDIWVAESGRG